MIANRLRSLRGGEDGLTYQCEYCLRWVPWFFGGDDDLGSFCDDCWVAFRPDRRRGERYTGSGWRGAR